MGIRIAIAGLAMAWGKAKKTMFLIEAQKGNSMAYTPELSYESSCTLRRIAWAFDMPMTKAMELVMDSAVKSFEHGKVCNSCRDKSRCETCRFAHKGKDGI